MQYRKLGRTGLNVSCMGLGGGGHSRLGMAKEKSEQDSIDIIRHAFDQGVNFFDTAEAYGTEPLLGKALSVYQRDQYILSSKKALWSEVDEQAVINSLERTLKQLGTDYIDIYHLHGVTPDRYPKAMETAYPALVKLKEQGKIRFLGITEAFERDTSHQMFQNQFDANLFDVIMVGFSILNQSARHSVLPMAIEADLGVLVMFAVRRALSQPARLDEIIQTLRAQGQIQAHLNDVLAAFEFAGANSIQDTAYRFCHYEPGCHVVLSGTSNIDHLKANLAAFDRDRLPQAVWDRFATLFQQVDAISGS